MTDAVVTELIRAAETFLGIAVTGLVAVKVARIGKRIDGRMDELLEINRKNSNSEGQLQGRADLKQEQKDDKITTPKK